MVSPSDVDLCVVQKESVQTFGRKVIPPCVVDRGRGCVEGISLAAMALVRV